MTNEELEEYLFYHKLQIDNYQKDDVYFYKVLFELYNRKQKYNNIVTPWEIFNLSELYTVKVPTFQYEKFTIKEFKPVNSLSNVKYDRIKNITRKKPLNVNYKPNRNKIENLIKRKCIFLFSSNYYLPVISFYWINEFFYGNYYFKTFDDANNYARIKNDS